MTRPAYQETESKDAQVHCQACLALFGLHPEAGVSLTPAPPMHPSTH